MNKIKFTSHVLVQCRLLYTSSMSSNLREIPTRSFHTLGARWRSRGFFVLMATPNSTPRNLNIAKSSSPEHAGFNRNLNIHSVSKWFSITVQGLLWTCVHQNENQIVHVSSFCFFYSGIYTCSINFFADNIQFFFNSISFTSNIQKLFFVCFYF